MPKIWIMLLIILTPLSPARGRGPLNGPSSDIRTVSVYTELGLLGYFVLGTQYQVNENLSLGIKGDIDYLSASGGGIKACYFFDPSGRDNFLGLNAINFEVSYLIPWDHPRKQAVGFELTYGHDGYIGSGIGLLWALGVGLSTDESPSILPVLKAGLHLDI